MIHSKEKAPVGINPISEYPNLRAIAIGMGLDADKFVIVSTTVRALIINPLDDDWRVDIEGTKWAMLMAEQFFVSPAFRVCVCVEAAIHELSDPGRGVAAFIELFIVRPDDWGQDEAGDKTFIGDVNFSFKSVPPGIDWRTLNSNSNIPKVEIWQN